MFLVISWVIAGAVFGSVGVAFIASSVVTGRPGYEVSMEGVALLLLTTTVGGAVGGAFLARMARRKYADNKRRRDQLALIPLLAVGILVAYAMLKP